MTKQIKMIGKRFGRLKVISEAATQVGPSGQHIKRYRCRCDCGKIKNVAGSRLRTGNTKSCGCLRKEVSAQRAEDRNLIHGDARSGRLSPEFISWSRMIDRCENPNHIQYDNYGGRGIRICRRWRTSYVNFLADMGRKPTPQHSLDRYPNNDGNYEPSNCRWATASEQSNNRRARKPKSSRRPARK